MNISNFRMKELHGSNPLDWFAVAEVDVETGILFWKKKTTKEVAHRFAAWGWCFTETGESADCFRAIQAWEAKNRKTVWEFK